MNILDEFIAPKEDDEDESMREIIASCKGVRSALSKAEYPEDGRSRASTLTSLSIQVNPMP